jgi:hypothetical protein
MQRRATRAKSPFLLLLYAFIIRDKINLPWEVTTSFNEHSNQEDERRTQAYSFFYLSGHLTETKQKLYMGQYVQRAIFTKFPTIVVGSDRD